MNYTSNDMNNNYNNSTKINKILPVLNKGFISENNYNSVKKAFFLQNKKEKIAIKITKFNKITTLPEGLNNNIKLMYSIINNYNFEIYLGDWTVLSLDEAINQYKDYCDNGQTNVFNIAIRYAGLGHVEVLSCDLTSHCLFYRRDGGSNGYDRKYNYNEILNYNSDKYNQLSFSDWFFNIEFDNELLE